MASQLIRTMTKFVSNPPMRNVLLVTYGKGLDRCKLKERTSYHSFHYSASTTSEIQEKDSIKETIESELRSNCTRTFSNETDSKCKRDRGSSPVSSKRQNIREQNGNESEETKVPQSATFQQLWSVLSPERFRLKLALAALVVSSTTTLAMPKLLGLLIDKFGFGVGSSTKHSLFEGNLNTSQAAELGLELVSSQSGLIIAAIILGAVASGSRLFLLESASERIAYRLRVRLFESLLKKKIEFFDSVRTGELVNRIAGDVTVTSRVLLDLSFGLRNIMTACVGTIAIFMIVPAQLVATLVAPVAAVFICGMIYGRFVRKLALEKQDRLGECTSRAEEKLSNIRTVKLFNGEQLESNQFKEEMDGVYHIGFLSSLAIGGRSTIYYAAAGSLLLHLIYRCGILVSTGLISLGDVTSLILYVMMTGASYQGVITVYGDVQKALGSCHKVMDLIHDTSSDEETINTIKTPVKNIEDLNFPIFPSSMNESQKIASASSVFSPSVINGSIKFHNVVFAYPTRPDQFVLRGLSLELPENSVTAVVGESGSGKTTLTSLLMRLYDPNEGLIQVGGINISAYSPAWIRSQFGVVNQEPILFAMTIRDNILYGHLSHMALIESTKKARLEGALLESYSRMGHTTKSHMKNYPEDDLNHLLEVSHAHDFINEFSDKLNTFVGERGSALSGGQKQRIALARSLARRPRFLILDEATSALDTRSEKIVHEALGTIDQSLTTLLITHRLSTLRYADYIAVLGDGKLAQFGPRLQVLQSPGVELRRILASQATP